MAMRLPGVPLESIDAVSLLSMAALALPEHEPGALDAPPDVLPEDDKADHQQVAVHIAENALCCNAVGVAAGEM